MATVDWTVAPPIRTEVGKLDDSAPNKDTVVTGDRIAAPPIGAEVGDPTPSGDTVTTGDRIAAPSIGVEIGKLDDPAPSGNTVATGDRVTTPPISVETGKLDTAVAPDEPTINVVEEPITATCTLTDEVGRPAAANEDSTALLTWLTSAVKAPAGDIAAIRAVTTLALPDPELPL